MRGRRARGEDYDCSTESRSTEEACRRRRGGRSVQEKARGKKRTREGT